MAKINQWALCGLILMAVAMIVKYNMEKPVTIEHFDNAMAETNAKIDSLKALVLEGNQKIDSISNKMDSVIQMQQDLKNGQRSIMDKLDNRTEFKLW